MPLEAGLILGGRVDAAKMNTETEGRDLVSLLFSRESGRGSCSSRLDQAAAVMESPRAPSAAREIMFAVALRKEPQVRRCIQGMLDGIT